MGCPPPIRIIPCKIIPSQWQKILTGHSSARVWNELSLHAIRQVLPQPTLHARNLYHVSAAMYDAWAAYDSTSAQVMVQEKMVGTSSDQAVAVAYAANRVLQKRYAFTIGESDVLECFKEGLSRLGLNPLESTTTGNSPAALGNRIGQIILDTSLNDGANEANNYLDTTAYAPSNPVLQPEMSGTSQTNPNLWQPLLLQTPFTQNNIAQSGPQVFITPHWGKVKPFAMTRTDVLYHDPGTTPQHNTPAMQTWIIDVLRKQSQLDNSSQTTDISPATLGNNSLGQNDGTGHPQNPVTGTAYAPVMQPQSAYWQTVAEYWADGPTSETPPGHWNAVANSVSDVPNFTRRWQGIGTELAALEWDVKVYLALNGALHDAAISAWEIKRSTNTARPISLVRYLAQSNQLPLITGLIENRNEQLSIKVTANQWLPASRWTPYQRFDFVTPAFPGFISGHSTFSHAAAVILTNVTGSKFFPNGLFEHVVPAFTNRIGMPIGVPIRLQWATYADAADQAGVSRLWGGIHIEPDDLMGRRIGHDIGAKAMQVAQKYFQNTK